MQKGISGFLIFLLLTVLWSNGLYVGADSEVHDVAVTNVTVFPAKVIGAGWITTNVTLENQGTSAESFNVTLYASYKSFKEGVPYASGNLTILNFTIAYLEAGLSITKTFKWEAFPWRLGIWPQPWDMATVLALLTANFTVRVEADVVQGEVDIADNVYIDGSVIVFWKVIDIDGNGKIDIRDIAYIAMRFGKGPGHPMWDPIFDIVSDGKIDIRDIAATAKSFGAFYR